MGAIYQLKAPFERGIINQALLRIRLNNELVDDNFFYYLFKELISKRITSGSGDSTIPNFPALEVIKNIEIELPDLLIQEKIGKIISAYDDKIEINNKINFEVEQMVKTLYDYWFVQFDFPDVNANPYKSSGGKMVYNSVLKREIPKNWEVKDLSDIANITMGQSPPGESYNEQGEGKVFYQGCTDFGNRFPTIRKYTTSPTRFAKGGDILLSVRAPVGTMNIAKEDCCIGRGLAALNSKDDCMSYLYEVMINLKQIFDRRNVNGTTFGSITKDDLFSLKVISPVKEILLKYDDITRPFFEKQNLIGVQNQELAQLRDWLLPMLMNGQVTVGNAEEMVNDQLDMVAESGVDYKKN
jgi:type I restriction enzyme S subunit